jgi:hypothetical protein
MSTVCVCGHTVGQHSKHAPNRACLACSVCGAGESADGHVMVRCECTELRFADDKCVCDARRDAHPTETCAEFVRDGSFNGTGIEVMR